MKSFFQLLPPRLKPSNLFRRFSDAKSDGSSHIQRPTSHLLPPQVLIQFMPNNIFITVSKAPGHLLFKLSSGTVGMKDAAKTQPKAAMALIDELHRRLAEANISKIRLNFRGIAWSRGTVVGQLRRSGLSIAEIIDSTGIPFNGCRPKKSRRT